MKALDERLRTYAFDRAQAISRHDADLVVSRALSRPSSRGAWARHGVNAMAAVALSLVLLAGGIILGMQLHGLRTGSRPPSPGPLSQVPDEVVDLDSITPAFDQVTPFRLRDGQVLAPRPRWSLEPGTALKLETFARCDHTVIHVINLNPQPADVRAPVSIPGCYTATTPIPNSTLVLFDHTLPSNGSTQWAGIDVYDWAAGRVIRTYDNVGLGLNGTLVSADGKRLYTLDPNGSATAQLEIYDLTAGALIVSSTLSVEQAGLNAGGIAFSPDQRLLYVNEGSRLQAVDAYTGKIQKTVAFKDSGTGPTAALPGWLSIWLPALVDGQAKENVEPGHGLAVDPSGRWVAALGIDAPVYDGIWIFDAGSMRLIRHIPNPSPSLHTGFRGLAASRDGSVLYALYIEAQQGSIDVIDPQSGRMRTFSNSRFSDVMGIAGVESAG